MISVGADEAELHRTQILIDTFKPISSRVCAELAELDGAHYPSDGATIVRLFGRANTQALIWLGAKGRVATEAAIIGFADAILIESGQPARAMAILPQAFISGIAGKKLAYDLSAAVFLVGALDETKAIAASVSRMGFKRIMIVDSDDRKAEQIVQYLRRRLLGIEIEAVPRRSLTQVPNYAAIAINLVDKSQTGLLEDISYLNFLKKNGVWIDWTNATGALGLDHEIRDAGATSFDAIAIRAWRDAWILNSVPGLLDAAGQKPEFIASALIAAWQKAAEFEKPSDSSSS
jgi:hypothetical protein